MCKSVCVSACLYFHLHLHCLGIWVCKSESAYLHLHLLVCISISVSACLPVNTYISNSVCSPLHGVLYVSLPAALWIWSLQICRSLCLHVSWSADSVYLCPCLRICICKSACGSVLGVLNVCVCVTLHSCRWLCISLSACMSAPASVHEYLCISIQVYDQDKAELHRHKDTKIIFSHCWFSIKNMGDFANITVSNTYEQ